MTVIVAVPTEYSSVGGSSVELPADITLGQSSAVVINPGVDLESETGPAAEFSKHISDHVQSRSIPEEWFTTTVTTTGPNGEVSTYTTADTSGFQTNGVVPAPSSSSTYDSTGSSNSDSLAEDLKDETDLSSSVDEYEGSGATLIGASLVYFASILCLIFSLYA